MIAMADDGDDEDGDHDDGGDDGGDRGDSDDGDDDADGYFLYQQADLLHFRVTLRGLWLYI